MWQDLFTALALVLVIEGILPFLSPRTWRQAAVALARQADRPLRLTGLGSMVIGVIILYLIN